MIVSEAFTINVLLALVLVHVINYDCKWSHNLERHLLAILEAKFTLVMCL